MPTPLTITILGSGTSAGVPMIGCHCAVCTSTDPRDHRTRPSIVVSYDGHNILIDTTPELRLQAVRARLDRISAVVYTHGHADHIFGLDDVRRYNTVMGAPLPLYAMPETMVTLRKAFGYAFEPPLDRNRAWKDAIYRPELEPVEINGPFELFGRTWQPIELPHGRFRVLGFRVGNFAYCTDCHDIPPESQEKLQGLEVLIIDALRARPHPTHLTFEQATVMAQTLGAKQTYFTHVAHEMKHADIEAVLPPEVRVGFDGLQVVVNDE